MKKTIFTVIFVAMAAGYLSRAISFVVGHYRLRDVLGHVSEFSRYRATVFIDKNDEDPEVLMFGAFARDEFMSRLKAAEPCSIHVKYAGLGNVVCYNSNTNEVLSVTLFTAPYMKLHVKSGSGADATDKSVYLNSSDLWSWVFLNLLRK